MLVPCGKCIECLKRKQNDLAVRCVREAERCGSMVFLTLTYDNDRLPVSCATELVDKETGEVFLEEKPSIISNDDVRAAVLSQVASKTPRYFSIADDDYDARCARLYTFTPSLCRSDFRLYLKRGRVRYERTHGQKLPEFKYVAVGEYGPKTCRPHMHVAFFGLNAAQVNELFDDWRKDFGFISCKQVQYVNGDGTKGFQIASKYIGKYMCKGKFDCQSVLKGYAEKPRICISRDFGTWLTQQLVDYYTCQDLFGRYDLNDISHLTEYQCEVLSNEITKRAKVNVYGYLYSMPKNLQKKLFYTKYHIVDKINKKLVTRYEATQIQDFRLDLLQDKFVDNYLAEFRQVRPNATAEEFAIALQMALSQRQIEREIHERAQEKDFLRGLFSQRSEF